MWYLVQHSFHDGSEPPIRIEADSAEDAVERVAAEHGGTDWAVSEVQGVISAVDYLRCEDFDGDDWD